MRENTLPKVHVWAIKYCQQWFAPQAKLITCMKDCSVTAFNPMMKITCSWGSLEAEGLINSSGSGAFSFFVYSHCLFHKNFLYHRSTSLYEVDLLQFGATHEKASQVNAALCCTCFVFSPLTFHKYSMLTVSRRYRASFV